MDASIREEIQKNGVIEITGDCKGCDQCVQYCPADAISLGVLGGRHVIDHDLCVNCGQCLVHCPFDRIQELSMVDYVKQAIDDPKKHVVIQFAKMDWPLLSVNRISVKRFDRENTQIYWCLLWMPAAPWAPASA